LLAVETPSAYFTADEVVVVTGPDEGASWLAAVIGKTGSIRT
jgi:hypothetical protein